jgi:hypothetical protein
MKVGTHAQESLKDIVARKTKEIEAAGVAFWGYGGPTCHPQTMVQPFSRTYDGTIYLCMQPMDSKHFAEQVPADEYSVDGVEWLPVPKGISVVGSRYALVVKNLRQQTFQLPLARTRVALGNSKGMAGSQYIRGRVDKACLEIAEESTLAPAEQGIVEIGLVADLVAPYAVYVRNKS